MKTESVTPLIEGKTKKILPFLGDPTRVVVKSKDDITAGDGRRHDTMEGKAELSTRTTCNVFNYLKLQSIPLSFVQKLDSISFLAEKCAMLPYEVVVRAEAHGSALERDPALKKGQVFDGVRTEFFLKTNGRKWKGHALICDDPYMQYIDGKIKLFDPHKPLEPQQPFLVLDPGEVFSHPNEEQMFSEMINIAVRTFLLLKRVWAFLGLNMVDFKIEFGINSRGELVVSDVIDNDSWRIIYRGDYWDKQGYRDGDTVADVLVRYRKIAELTDQFPMIKTAA